MKLLTQRDLIRGVADRWDYQYRNTKDDDKKEIGRRLRLLDLETCSAEVVNLTIGNSYWTTVDKCNECGKEPAVIQVGQEPDYESATANLCLECVRKAAQAVGLLPK